MLLLGLQTVPVLIIFLGGASFLGLLTDLQILQGQRLGPFPSCLQYLAPWRRAWHTAGSPLLVEGHIFLVSTEHTFNPLSMLPPVCPASRPGVPVARGFLQQTGSITAFPGTCRAPHCPVIKVPGPRQPWPTGCPAWTTGHELLLFLTLSLS